MKEKGVVAPIVVLAVIFGVALLSVGAIQSKNDLSQKLEAIISSKLEANIPKATIPEKLTEIETKEIKEDQKVNPDMIIIPGRIPILEGESIYKIYLPKKGGEVKGTISGVCNGNVTGTYDGKNFGTVSGNIVVNCPVGPGNLFKPQVKIQYEGKVNLAEGKINGSWKITEPITAQNDFQLAFTPISADQNPGDNKDKLVASGFFPFSLYKFSSNVPYEFSVPKSGGSVTGSIGGACSGAPEGNFDGKDGGKVEGKILAKCTMGSIVSMDIEIKYTGTVLTGEKKAFIDYEMQKPFAGQRGSLPIYFNN
ncbi:hypothetical protein A3J19_04910 [Candidatus Daviesbacteria bacterium RIFCSPLOWO2_02_FULL_41_8]|uniref:Uncharacterized protein n=3 Tax=Candidatus Daviesiibacteriota TaxID=1752718 RepID=A0A1F5NHZ3_9BACT|nr:MAG: hypothetical protein A2871_02645 [Candidatus Daviesbacteria bacterium RIFCSPHIGHO2_01_FULL_41_23]OGE33808.1 MAG: hypothetical protein A3D83_04520 [Candidatus Daviesbacteria bacterium RIFCSPHIGHO2_02_FULL_41_10]OGE62075.1 MAG: hypothetical protein A2967_00260 [Candidatus Daviesbacteria bacterium RIFCSPLOWO2_01_FULL_41_32]OGE77040.1 MAG: hypothetical protein A3J19_04910 [Candidatus Daviesbacteria bacterium RIFCSPLOWO2_02_FULL_41_8]